MTQTKRTRPDAEGVYQRILSAIMERKLQPGIHLKEEELCEVFAISRGGIRKVLQRLAHHNLIDLIPNSGAYVATSSVAEAREVFHARRLIEGELVRELARVFDNQAYAQLDAHISEEEAAFRAQDTRRHIRLSGEFHLKIAELSQKPVLTQFLREIISRTSLIIAQYQKETPNKHPQEPCQEHRHLLEALARGDTEGAVELMNVHLEHLEAALDMQRETETGPSLQKIFAE